MALEHLLKPRITELGKIKIGMKGEARKSQRGTDWQPPVKLDHFLITRNVRGTDGNFLVDDDLMRSLSHLSDPDGRLRQIPIGVLSNDLEEVLQVRYTSYDGKRLRAESDGVTLTSYIDPKSGQPYPEPKAAEWRPEYAERKDAKGNPLFKLQSVFRCVVNAQEARFGGVYTFRSTSVVSANQLYGTLKHVAGLTGGVLRGLPLRLVVRPIQVRGGQSTVHVVHCELVASDLANAQAMALDRARTEIEFRREIEAARKEYVRLALPPGKADDPEDVVPEFFPEQALPPLKSEVHPLLAGVVDAETATDGPPSEEEIEALEKKRGER